jgi:O-antigen/teichoic acid export membrane protein
MIAPLLTFIERFVLGAMISVGSIPFFAVPSEVVVRLLIIPMSIVNALFPFMSRSWILDDGKKVVNLIYQRCVKYLYLTVVPIVFVLTIFSGEILKIWLGIEFMEKSSLILSVLAAGYLFNSLSQIPFVALQALGRPDLPAKISLLQVPVYTGLFVALTAGWGLIGSAIAWLVRVSCESFFLFFFARRIMHAKANPADLSYIWKASILFAAGGLFIFAAQVHSLRVEWQVGLLLVIGGLYAVGLWLFALDEKDKDFVQRHTLGFLR